MEKFFVTVMGLRPLLIADFSKTSLHVTRFHVFIEINCD